MEVNYMVYGFGYENRLREGHFRSFRYGPCGGRKGPGFVRGSGVYGRRFHHDHPVTPEIRRARLQLHKSYLSFKLELIKQRIQEVERRLEDLEPQSKEG
jgi:hypothetical protein